MAKLLSLELLERLDRTLRELGAAIVDRWEPPLTDALTEPRFSAARRGGDVVGMAQRRD